MKKKLNKEDQARFAKVEKLIHKAGYGPFWLFAFRVYPEENQMSGYYFHSELEPVKAGIAEIFRQHPKVMTMFGAIMGEVLGEARMMHHPLFQGKA